MNNIPTMMVSQQAQTLIPPPMTFPIPLSYEFRVVEYVDEGKIIKARMQVKINQHDQYGNITLTGHWEDVPRVQFNLDGVPNVV